jgi:hypothetical protein
MLRRRATTGGMIPGMKLEKTQVGQAEGENEKYLLRILGG